MMARKHLHASEKMMPYEACDTNHNPLKRCAYSSKGNLVTLISNIGVIFAPAEQGSDESDEGRRFLPTELWTAQGFPVSESCIRAASGTVTQFSRGSAAPGCRTLNEQMKQVGNGVHMLFVGAFNVADPLLGLLQHRGGR